MNPHTAPTALTTRRTAPRYALVLALALALLGLTLAQTGTARAAGHPGTAAATRIMPLGDSITGSPGCWRALLWRDLMDAGHTDIDFVGTQAPQGCGFPHDGEHEGHGGFLATGIAEQNLLPGWLAATTPDVVLMHLGTNDIWSARTTPAVLDAYTTLIGQMRDANPHMRILVAQIIPMDPANCAACGERVTDLNAAIPGWAAGLTTTDSPITVVDQWTGFSTAADTTDGVHPNDAGTRKIADRWYPAVVDTLTGAV
ncbi:SGNH/GDSL hydrolase family protein [Streptomyces harbinensis]|uniref:SGNH/GDSL hydrolase family protein n=1 Tax=Streptomyces harbinensis TaxID=1176198 RepID=UPI00339784FF